MGILANLMQQQNPLLGVLGPEQAQAAGNYGLLNAGLSILAASQPNGVGAGSYTPTLGQGLTAGFKGLLDGGQAYTQNALNSYKAAGELTKLRGELAFQQALAAGDGDVKQAPVQQAGMGAVPNSMPAAASSAPASNPTGAAVASGGNMAASLRGAIPVDMPRALLIGVTDGKDLIDRIKSWKDANPKIKDGFRLDSQGNPVSPLFKLDPGHQLDANGNDVLVPGYAQNAASLTGANAAAQLPSQITLERSKIIPNGKYMSNGRLMEGPIEGGTGLPPGSAASAVYGNESNYGKNAGTSSAGAYGPMQLLPSTAANPGFGITPAKDNSPEENMRVGTQYFGALKNKYGNDTHALMAYDWGTGNVDNWLKSGGDPSKVPNETRRYVGDAMMRMNAPQAPTVTPGASATDQSYATEAGKNAATYETGLNSRVTTGFNLNTRLDEEQKLLDQFRTGATAPVRAKLAAYVKDLGFKDLSDRVAGGDVSAAQEFAKLSSQSAVEALKQSLASDNSSSAPIRVAEFNVFQKNNPNLATDPDAIRKVFAFQRQLYNNDLAEQKAYIGYKASGQPLENFPATYAQQREAQRQANQTQSATPKTVAPGQVINGHQFLGGDPKNRLNWKAVANG